MGTLEKILIGILLLAIAAFPVSVFLYLRTAYREGAWPGVKEAAIVAAVAMLICFGGRLWIEWELNHFERAVKHPFALGSILFVVLMWLAHRTLKARLGEMLDHH